MIFAIFLQAQDLDKEAQAELSKIPEGVAHLDFGSRHGGGVVGPKLGRVAEREADKFEVQEGSAAELSLLRQLLACLIQKVMATALSRDFTCHRDGLSLG